MIPRIADEIRSEYYALLEGIKTQRPHIIYSALKNLHSWLQYLNMGVFSVLYHLMHVKYFLKILQEGQRTRSKWKSPSASIAQFIHNMQ